MTKVPQKPIDSAAIRGAAVDSFCVILHSVFGEDVISFRAKKKIRKKFNAGISIRQSRKHKKMRFFSSCID